MKSKEVEMEREEDSILEIITTQIQDLRTRKKEIEGKLERARAEFFKVATKRMENRAQEHRVEVPMDIALTPDELQTHLDERYPRYQVEECEPGREGWRVKLRERPEFLPFRYANAQGRIFERRISEGQPKMDLEALKTQHPEIWANVVVEKTVYEVNDKQVATYLQNHPEALAVMTEYLIPKRPVTSLHDRDAEEDER